MRASVLGACVLRFHSLFFHIPLLPPSAPHFLKRLLMCDTVQITLNITFQFVHEFVFARLCSGVCVCVFVWAVEVLPLRRQSLQGPRSFVASHPLPLHLTNYCATSTPLMRPGTCPSVLLWARLVSLYWYRKKTPSHPALWRDFFFYFLFFFFLRSDAVN